VSSILRLSILPTALIACLLSCSPAYSGDFFGQTACDSTASDETTYTLMLIDLSGSDICKVELRPEAVGSLAAAPITSWEMPIGWAAEPLEGVPGAIVLHGCVQAFHSLDGFKITMPGRAGKIHGIGYDSTGLFDHDVDHVFFCGSDPTPAAASTWGRLKSLYR
jgi:hypothetical protein